MKPTRFLLIFILALLFMGVLNPNPLFAKTDMPEPNLAPARDEPRENRCSTSVRGDLEIVEVRVKVHDASGNPTPYEKIADSLIRTRQGDRFSQDKLRESIEALKLCNRFQEVAADSREEGGGIVLLFSLKPYEIIKNIKMKGVYPLFEREVLNHMTLYPGDVFERKELSEQASLIERLYENEGYVNPRVEVSAEKDPTDGFVVVHVHIHKGPYYALKRLDIRGNHAFRDRRLKIRMVAWRKSLLPGSPGRFIVATLKKDVETLTKFYRGKRYADVEIQSRVERDPEANEAYVLLTIREGPRYCVHFTGDDHVWKWNLKKDVVLFKQGNRYDRGVRKSVKNIEARYRKKGFLQTEVDVVERTETQEDRPVRDLAFVLHEGPRFRVSSIRFSGNQAFTNRKLKKQMLTRPKGLLDRGILVPEILEDDRTAITSLYLRQGYLDAKVNEEVLSGEGPERTSIHVQIEEGPQTSVASVKVQGVTSLSQKEIMESVHLKKGQPFRRYMVRSDKNALSARISEKGYPRVKVTGDVSFSRDKSEARIVYNVEEGPYVQMGRTYYAGNFRTKTRIFERELEMKAGEPFSLEKMLNEQRNIRDLEILDSVRFKTVGLEEGAEHVTLFVDVEEKKPYYLEVGGGYESQRGLFGHAKVGDRNLLGRNKDVWVAGEASQVGYRGEGGITEPRLFGTRLSASFSLFGEETQEFNQNFGTVSYGSTLGLHRKWTQRLRTGMNVSFEKREQFLRSPTGSEASLLTDEQLDQRSIVVNSPYVRYDTRDSFIRPKKGLLTSFYVDISKGLENSLDDFIKFWGDLRFYWTPVERLTLAWHGWAGHIEPYGGNRTVPKDQLFFLGGTLDIRGFRENLLLSDLQGDSVGGRTAWVTSLEGRIDLGFNFELDVFWDAGRLSNTYNQEAQSRLGSSSGIGLRYITPIGPVGVLYGFKLDRRTGESIGRVHFAVGYTF